MLGCVCVFVFVRTAITPVPGTQSLLSEQMTEGLVNFSYYGGELRTPAFNNLEFRVIFSIIVDQIPGPSRQSFEQIQSPLLKKVTLFASTSSLPSQWGQMATTGTEVK